MGFLLGGPFYHMRGRTGNNVGRVVRGKNVFAMRPVTNDRPASPLQQIVRDKLTLITGWMSEVSSFIRIGFEDYEQEMSAWNAAVKYNRKYAVTGTAPNWTVDYSNALLSRGKLSGGLNLAMATTEDAQLDLTWDAGVPDLMPGDDTDKLAVVIYNPSKEQWVVSVGAALRSTESLDLAVPILWSGDTVYPYVSFVSDNGREVSTSVMQNAVVIL